MHPPSNKIKVIHVITRFDKGGSAENTFLTVRGLDEERYDVMMRALKNLKDSGHILPAVISAPPAGHLPNSP